MTLPKQIPLSARVSMKSDEPDRKMVWRRRDDPRAFSSEEECRNAALFEGPLRCVSYFQVVETAAGLKFFAWGNSFSVALCVEGSGLKMSDRIDVVVPKTYAELRKLKANLGA